MGRHYHKLEELFKSKKPNSKVLKQLLELELEGRRNYIESFSKDEDNHKVEKMLKAYPCFKNLEDCMEEMRRLIDAPNENYISEVQVRMEDLWETLFLWGISKRVFGPPKQSTIDSKASLVMINLDKIFQFKGRKPLLHVVKKTESLDRAVRQVAKPGILYDYTTNQLFVATQGRLFSQKGQNWTKAVVGVLSLYYTFQLTYPPGFGTFLSFLQTEVLKDEMDPKDKTGQYRQFTRAFKEFVQ